MCRLWQTRLFNVGCGKNIFSRGVSSSTLKSRVCHNGPAEWQVNCVPAWAFAPSLLPHAPGAMPSLNPGDPLESPGPAAQTPRQASSQDQSAKPTLASPSQPWPTKASQGLAGAREKLSILPSALLRTTAPRHNVFTVWPVVQPPQQPPLDTLYLRRAVVRVRV